MEPAFQHVILDELGAAFSRPKLSPSTSGHYACMWAAWSQVRSGNGISHDDSLCPLFKALGFFTYVPADANVSSLVFV